MSRFHQGKFKSKNPHKYVGDVNNIIYRSSWELSFLMHLDSDDSIIKYSSEELAIPYKSPVDGRTHRYFPDFIVQHKDKRIVMVEIKPFIQTQPPMLSEGKKPNNRRHKRDLITYAINQSKWEAAEAFCQQKGWQFQVVTEKQLYGR